MSEIDYVAQAQRLAGQVARANGDHLNTAQTAVADGLAGLIYALLAINGELQQVTAELRILNYERTHP